MNFFFNPDGVAIIGASDNPLRGGYHILNNISGGYKGRIYPVNPKHDSILGMKCYPDISSILCDFDLAIYFIPAIFLPSIIEECAKKNVRGIIIESAGFAEVGEEGKKLQEECTALAGKHNIRLWGPNCMGLLDGHSRHVFSFMYSDLWKTLMVPGNVSMIVQSGMLSAIFLMTILEKGGMGVNKICSIGNKCDVNETDLLEYLIDDPLTGVIGLYAESIVDVRRFMKLCRSTTKPVVVLKGGRSPSGARAAVSHTASLAGNYTIMKHAFKQSGIIPAYDFNELMDILRGFSKTGHSKNNGGTAIISFSGGGGIVTADFLHDFDLPLASLSGETLKSIKEVFPAWMDPSNPVDIWPAVEKNGVETVYTKVVDAVMHDRGVDSLIVHAFSGICDSSVFRPLARLKEELGKPVIAWLVGVGEPYHAFKRDLEDMGIPVFEEMGRGVRFLHSVKQHYSKKPYNPNVSGL
ncbi:MAG: CoA-binding protein [Deltaproteobacteria bacterium]|nr:CoA-binding protein [Deltaproteobacteria bacterium]